MTPPPGADGGLLNAITGSLIMTTLGVAIGTPLGMLAGTYMAEYGRYSDRNDTAAGRRWRFAERHHRQSDHDHFGRGHRHSARHAGGNVHGRIRPLFRSK